MPAHRLGPHVVGQRVVIRSLLPDGSATDALGVCTAWGDSVCEVETARGPVAVPIDAIVAGKPVPPRPSHLVRVSAREAELHGLALVPDVETAPLGEWVLRSSPDVGGRLLKRGNSCLAMGSPDGSLEDALAAVVAFYKERGRPPMAQVEQGSPTEAAFAAAGWRPLGRGDASFRAAPVARLHRQLREQVVSPTPVLVTASASRPQVEVRDEEGVRVAAGAAILDGDWLCLHGLMVDEAHRRRGLATALIADLAEWGAERGARTAWLHVETDNAPALALYDGLGFSEHHAVRYLVPAVLPAGSSSAAS